LLFKQYFVLIEWLDFKQYFRVNHTYILNSLIRIDYQIQIILVLHFVKLVSQK